jgi:hypothetical protein
MEMMCYAPAVTGWQNMRREGQLTLIAVAVFLLLSAVKWAFPHAALVVAYAFLIGLIGLLIILWRR